jgi:hypothetical protein
MRKNMESGKKKLATRSISFILALVFVFSIFSGMISAEEVPKENNSLISAEETEVSIFSGITSAEEIPEENESNSFILSEETGFGISSGRVFVTQDSNPGGISKTWTWISKGIKIVPGWLKKILSKKVYFEWTTKIINERGWKTVCKITCPKTGGVTCEDVYGKVREYTEKVRTLKIDPFEIGTEIISKILPFGSATYRVTVDPTTSSLISYINWAEGDLDLVLYSPNGTRIDPSVAANDMDISYGKGMVDTLYMAIYAIQNPEPGDWTMEITAIDVPTEGEDYYATAYLISNLTLTLYTDKDKYNQSEPINIRADLKYNGIPLTEALVTLEIQKSDATVANIPLFDDGSHGDIQANDGTYSNIYTNTNVGGQYNLIVDSSGTIDGYPFTRTISKLIAVEMQKANFNNIYSDYGTDTDGDELYNYLTVDAGINVNSSGNYTLEGWLYDINGREIVFAYNDTYLDAGNQTILLNFDGLQIQKYGADGPFNLGYLILLDENYTLADYRYDAYNTSAYNYTDFQAQLAVFTSDYADYGIDTDGDGLYDYLTIDVGVNITAQGNYSLLGYLYDANGSEVVWSIDYGSLDVGNHTLHLDFDGKTIQMHGVSGPYYLKDLRLSGENWTLMDYISDAYNTSAYNYTDFVDPVSTENEVTISGVGLGEIRLIVSFKDTIPVFAGRYSYDLVGINVPQRPNNFTITTSEVKNLKVGVKKIQDNTTRLWVTQTIAAPEGIATVQSDWPSPGNYHVKVFGNAAEGVSEVDLELTAVKKIKASGDFSLSIDISGFPAGKYNVTATADTGCFTDLTLEGLPLDP